LLYLHKKLKKSPSQQHALLQQLTMMIPLEQPEAAVCNLYHQGETTIFGFLEGRGGRMEEFETIWSNVWELKNVQKKITGWGIG